MQHHTPGFRIDVLLYIDVANENHYDNDNNNNNNNNNDDDIDNNSDNNNNNNDNNDHNHTPGFLGQILIDDISVLEGSRRSKEGSWSVPGI